MELLKRVHCPVCHCDQPYNLQIETRHDIEIRHREHIITCALAEIDRLNAEKIKRSRKKLQEVKPDNKDDLQDWSVTPYLLEV